MGNQQAALTAMQSQVDALQLDANRQNDMYDKLIGNAEHALKNCNEDRLQEMKKAFADIEAAQKKSIGEWKELTSKLGDVKQQLYDQMIAEIKESADKSETTIIGRQKEIDQLHDELKQEMRSLEERHRNTITQLQEEEKDAVIEAQDEVDRQIEKEKRINAEVRRKLSETRGLFVF